MVQLPQHLRYISAASAPAPLIVVIPLKSMNASQ